MSYTHRQSLNMAGGWTADKRKSLVTNRVCPGK